MSTATIEQATRDEYARNRDAVTASVKALDSADGIGARAFHKIVNLYVTAGAPIIDAGVTANQWAKWANGITTSAQWSEYVASVRESKGDASAQVAPPRRESFTRALVIATCAVERFAGDVDAMRADYLGAVGDGEPTLTGLVKWCKGGDTAKVPPSPESTLRAAVRKCVRAGMSFDDIIAIVSSELDSVESQG